MNKRSKTLYLLAFGAILIFVAKDTYDEYKTIRAVQYKIENLQIRHSNTQKDIQIDLIIAFYNNSSHEFELQGLDLDVLSDNGTLLGKIQKQQIKIHPQKTKTEVSLDIKVEDVSVNIGQLLTSKEVFIYISGNVTYKAGIFGIPITIDIHEPLNVKDELLKLLRKKIGL